MTCICVLFKSKKSVVAETSAVFHYSEKPRDEPGPSGRTDAIFRAATKDLLTLMKLDVSVGLRNGVAATPDPRGTCFFLSSPPPPVLGSTSL